MEVQGPTIARMDVEWLGERRFRGGAPNGPTLLVDGERRVSPSPVESVVAALASCSAIDVIEILRKRRTPAHSLRVEVEYSRAEIPPRRLTSVLLRFLVSTASDISHVERAIALSLESYCSVSASLRPDLPVTWEVELLPVEAAERE